MRKLCAAVDRFCLNHPRFGIPNLMRFIVIATAVVFFLDMFSQGTATDMLVFNLGLIRRGELWRLVTWPIVPTSYQPFSLIISLYFYYMIGTSLEREWGTPKFNLYYFSGVVLTVITGIITALATGQNVVLAGTAYVNLSMFFAFAMLYPNAQFLLFFLIPVKVKWLAWIDGAFFALSVLTSLFRLYWLGALLPIIALLNFFVFFWSSISDEIAYRQGRTKHQTSRQTIQFKSAVKQQRKKEEARGYRHKCTVCSRTDADFPDLEFRYCSRCAGYHCFCQDHIFDHVHFTE